MWVTSSSLCLFNLDLLFRDHPIARFTEITHWFLLNLVTEVQNKDLIRGFKIFESNQTTKNNHTTVVNIRRKRASGFKNLRILRNYLFPRLFLCIKGPYIIEKLCWVWNLFIRSLTTNHDDVFVLECHGGELGTSWWFEPWNVEFGRDNFGWLLLSCVLVIEDLNFVYLVAILNLIINLATK